MRRFLGSLIVALLALAPAASRLRADSLADMQSQVDQLEKQLGDAQTQLDDAEPQIEGLVGDIRKDKYGGSSNPEVSGSYGVLGKDADASGVAARHGVALLAKMDLSMNIHLDNGGTIQVGFGPAFTPAGFPAWVLDDTDELHKGLGTASRLGTLLGTFKGDFKKGAFTATTGFMSFQTSIFTLSGPLSDRPILFDRNPYQANVTSKNYYENQFLTGVPQRAPEESEHYIMGLRTDWDFARNLSLMDWIGNYEGFYDNYTLAHEYGLVLSLDKKDAFGGFYKLIGYNRSNDTGEITALGGNPNNPFFGLVNNSLVSVMGTQRIKKMDLVGELSHANYNDFSGAGGYTETGAALVPVALQGFAWRLQSTTNMGDQKIVAGAYGIDPGYLVSDQVGKYNANANNLVRYRDDPDHAGQIIQQTVVGDPTLSINDSDTVYIGGQFRLGNAFLNLKLQDSQQIAATDARIWSSHFLGGSNLNDATWFTYFNNNYQAWLPPAGMSTGYGSTNLEREFFYNPRRDPPTVAFPTTLSLNNYDQTYAPLFGTPTAVAAGATYPGSAYQIQTPGWSKATPLGVVPDANGKLYYDSYRQLETNLWRKNFESIVNADPNTGLALVPSQKSVSDLTADLRMNLADWLPLRNHALFFQIYGEILTVNDQALLVPSLDPQNLFVQSILDSTMVYNLNDSVNLVLNLGMENWVTDRTVKMFMDNEGHWQNGTLEYHDREGGVGMDWNAIPNKLNLYMRIKLFDHVDSFAGQNSFTSHQMWWEMKSYF